MIIGIILNMTDSILENGKIYKSHFVTVSSSKILQNLQHLV